MACHARHRLPCQWIASFRHVVSVTERDRVPWCRLGERAFVDANAGVTRATTSHAEGSPLLSTRSFAALGLPRQANARRRGGSGHTAVASQTVLCRGLRRQVRRVLEACSVDPRRQHGQSCAVTSQTVLVYLSSKPRMPLCIDEKTHFTSDEPVDGDLRPRVLKGSVIRAIEGVACRAVVPLTMMRCAKRRHIMARHAAGIVLTIRTQRVAGRLHNAISSDSRRFGVLVALETTALL